jgi:hypothetical protein
MRCGGAYLDFANVMKKRLKHLKQIDVGVRYGVGVFRARVG